MGWADAVVTDPRRAYAQGPPNGLVVERERRGEDHMTAVARVKREDFLRLNPDWYAEHVTGIVPTKVSLQENVPTTIVPTLDTCLEQDCTRPREGRYKVCAACRKRSQRG